MSNHLKVVHVHHPRVKVVDLGLLTPTFGSSWWLLTTLWRKLLLVLMALMLLLVRRGSPTRLEARVAAI